MRMLPNYLKIAWRSLRRNPVFALISIAGLALGSCICLVVWLVCSYEFSFDTFHPNRDRIYRLTSSTNHGGNVLRHPVVLAPVPAALRKKISGVDAITDISPFEVKSAIRSPADRCTNLTTERLLSRTRSTLPFSNMTGLPVTRRLP